ncbi:hypothetical protein EJB05_32879 [Eragrostis curvula]|uniref:Uncharacterized protein n=1 Tax=Eragrostis curvula TaxID=38414 RepID=A0A5J9U0D2_9POAL|nr:hypothetical protein EJB05_32879 [Eragrostis curvula]
MVNQYVSMQYINGEASAATIRPEASQYTVLPLKLDIAKLPKARLVDQEAESYLSRVMMNTSGRFSARNILTTKPGTITIYTEWQPAFAAVHPALSFSRFSVQTDWATKDQ